MVVRPVLYITEKNNAENARGSKEFGLLAPDVIMDRDICFLHILSKI